LKNVIAKYFNNSYLGVISSLVKEEEISVEELKKIVCKLFQLVYKLFFLVEQEL